MADLISIILTTYEREDALDAVLSSLAGQIDRGFEIVVADDGSGPGTTALVERWKLLVGVPLAHVWQPRRGFRAAESRNRALLASRGPYCIFLDGDCVVRPDFVGTHRSLAEQGWFVTGNRALLSEALTATILRDQLSAERWSLAQWAMRRVGGGINRLTPLLQLPLGPLRRLRPQAWQGARSCNLGVWRNDLERIDGFDGSYVGWGREDSDLLVRLLHSGVRRKDGVFATGVLHLWHPQADRAALSQNDLRLEGVRRSGCLRAEQGLSKLRRE